MNKITADKKVILLPETVTVHELAQSLDQTAAAVITELMKNGVMATINDQLDRDTATIIASEFGVTVQPAEDQPEPQISAKRQTATKSKTAQPRPPVIAVMGHVDHGKTSLLDAIRGSNAIAGEAGGITQHISASQITHQGRELTLLDTPGHEAFASLRQHGAALTDVAVLVVAADDGVKPQTKEAAEFARKAGVPIVVAINKVDLPAANLDQVKKQLADIGLNPEEWGGDTVIVPVSAKSKTGIKELLDMILLVADINELTADIDVPAEGIIIESHMSTGQGPVATMLIEQGTLRPRDLVVAGYTYAKVRQMTDENHHRVETAGPSRAVTVTGFKAVPNFGDRFQVVKSEKEARIQAQSAKTQAGSATRLRVTRSINSADIIAELDANRLQSVLPVIIKTDVRGSQESLVHNLEELGNEEVSVKVIASGVGNINESDITLAKSTQALVIGFQVSLSTAVKRVAARDGVSVKIYSVIYELLDDVKSELQRMLAPETIETELGKLIIKGVFRTSRQQIICGGEVTEGKALPDVLVRLEHGSETLGEAEVTSLERNQQPAKEVNVGELCGLQLKTAHKIQLAEGDRLIFFKREQRERSLA